MTIVLTQDDKGRWYWIIAGSRSATAGPYDEPEEALSEGLKYITDAGPLA